VIGIRGVPLTESFEWVKWRRTWAECVAIGADAILSDLEARRRGILVDIAKEHAYRTVYSPCLYSAPVQP